MAIERPDVRLGRLEEGGLAPAIMAIVDRGVDRRPALAAALEAEVELRLGDGYPPVRIVFGPGHVLVEDGPGVDPDLRVLGSLPDVISLLVTPMLRGMPNPIDRRGRAALGMVAFGRLRVEGRRRLMRNVVDVMRL